MEFHALGYKMLLITFPSLKIISALRYHSQGCMEAVVALFSVLSGMPEGTVSTYFKRRVSNGRAKVIVILQKGFVFLYEIKAGQLLITFHY